MLNIEPLLLWNQYPPNAQQYVAYGGPPFIGTRAILQYPIPTEPWLEAVLMALLITVLPKRLPSINRMGMAG